MSGETREKLRLLDFVLDFLFGDFVSPPQTNTSVWINSNKEEDHLAILIRSTAMIV